MLLLLRPSYASFVTPPEAGQKDTHDGIDYSNYLRPSRPAQKAVVKAKAKAEAKAKLEAINKKVELAPFDDSDYKKAQRQLGEFYVDIQNILAELNDLEAKRELLSQYEQIARILFEQETRRRREEEEILAFLLCQ